MSVAWAGRMCDPMPCNGGRTRTSSGHLHLYTVVILSFEKAAEELMDS
jgi:hypothetical protein